MPQPNPPGTPSTALTPCWQEQVHSRAALGMESNDPGTNWTCQVDVAGGGGTGTMLRAAGAGGA